MTLSVHVDRQRDQSQRQQSDRHEDERLNDAPPAGGLREVGSAGDTELEQRDRDRDAEDSEASDSALRVR
jgi:hypothetical protein